jgi:5-(carboxyamino)imidazole ribonucleotide mutase
MCETSPTVVGILLGSDNDWPLVEAAAAALDEFGVAHEIRVMSAHRTPEIVRQYATTAAGRGLKVIIAAAGGAAHLAGVVASHTTLPVVGIPVPTALAGGLDSLLSTLQMPGRSAPRTRPCKVPYARENRQKTTGNSRELTAPGMCVSDAEKSGSC